MSQDTKICIKCGCEHPIDYYNWKNKEKGRRTGVCKTCTRTYATDYYRDNMKKMKSNSLRSNYRRRGENAEAMYKYLLNHPCVDCGESDPRVLDPDHLRDKKRNISRMMHSGYTWNGVLKELDKCEIRCANCHRRKTAREQGWRKALWWDMETAANK